MKGSTLLWVFACCLFFALGWISGILQKLPHEPTPPASYAPPTATFPRDGRHCIAWSARYHGQLLYSVHCDDGTVELTSNYLYP